MHPDSSAPSRRACSPQSVPDGTAKKLSPARLTHSMSPLNPGVTGVELAVELAVLEIVDVPVVLRVADRVDVIVLDADDVAVLSAVDVAVLDADDVAVLSAVDVAVLDADDVAVVVSATLQSSKRSCCTASTTVLRLSTVIGQFSKP